jgi:two-component system, chemotaxis family, sensor kinase CheA
MDPMMQQVLAIFADEFRELSAGMIDALIRADKNDSMEMRGMLMADIYRRAHSIKGTAGTLGLFDLEEFAHAVESSLTPFRSGERKVLPKLAQVILKGIDLAQWRVESARMGTQQEDPDLRASAAELLRLALEENPKIMSIAPGIVAKPEPEQAPPPAVAEPDHEPEPDAPDDPPAEPAPITREIALPSAVDPASERAKTRESTTVRVAQARLSAVERQLDELRGVRSALETRIEDTRRMVWTLQAALTGRLGGLDRDLAQSVEEQAQALHRGLSTDVGELSTRIAEIDDELRGMQMLPVETLLAPLTRAVWEHALSVGKNARLEVVGAKVALDRKLLQELKDPFLHLCRNAVDHGIETPDERRALGKSPEGRIRIEVEQRGAQVAITFSDDGAGVDLDRVRRVAVERAVLTQQAAAELDEDGVHALLFAPGFSTRETVTRTSGRGVGLDVVRENIVKVGGKVSLRSRPKIGSRFLIEVPLTLAAAQAMLFEAGSHVLALPLSAVAWSKYVSVNDPRTDEIELEGQLLPVHALSQLLGLKSARARRSGFPVLICRAADRLMAFQVDRLLGEREVVVRPLPPELIKLRHLAAATPLGDGRLAFILNPRFLSEAALGPAPGEIPSQLRRRRVVVVDDSITTRSLHRQVLEAAGFEVETASDGEEALRVLKARGADLVVSDINMPRLDGLSLTRRIRTEPQLERTPVVLVSSLDSDEDKERARDAGASAYLPKGAYQRGELLKLVQGLLPS